MTDFPLITCVILTYRRPQMVARAIRSVLNQTFTRLRVFVSDNASGDETAEVVRGIQASDPRVIYHCQHKNVGGAANFAYSVSRVETPFFSLLSDDDVLLPEFYEIAFTNFEKYPQAIFVATQVPCVNKEGRVHSEPLSMWDRMGLFDPPHGAHRVAAIAHPTITGVLFRREFLETPYVPPDPNIHAGDYEMLLNAALHYPVVAVARRGALFVSHEGFKAAPSDPISVMNDCVERIRRVDMDDRFPPQVKAANRQRWMTYLSCHLPGLVIRLALRNDCRGVERALAILGEDVGRADLAAKLRLFYHLCCLLPPLRPTVLTLYESISKWKKRRRDSFLPLVDDLSYLEYLRLV